MRLVPRDTNFNSIASVLSLAAANYKPIPQLPTSNQVLSPATITNGNSTLVSNSNKGNSFKVQNPGSTTSWTATHNSSDWGVPSTLYVPVNSASSTTGMQADVVSTGNSTTDSSRQLAASKTVGPGKCPYSAGYTPQGGWQNLPAPTFPAFDPVKATIMRYRQQQGVNLGAWFVQEGWMESNFMSCATGSKQAEFDILDGFGTSADGLTSAQAYMEQHWDTWITEADFIKLATMGINTVRLPIGYWSVGPYFTHSSPFQQYQSVYQYSWRYIARAINWAAKYDIGVIVDLHGAYGSQNGQPHSGLSDGNIEWYNSYNQGLTTELLVWLANEISDVTNVVGIELLNEPQNRDSYWSWLPTAMDAMRNASSYAKTIPLYFHDAFVLSKGASFVQSRSDFVVSDHHSYYVYTSSDQALSAQGHISKLDGSIMNAFVTQSGVARRNLIVGEWSCALASSSLQGSSNPQADQTDFCQTQQDIWQTTSAGYSFWSYKMENCDQNSGWCFDSARSEYLAGNFSSWGIPFSALSLNASSPLSNPASSNSTGEKTFTTFTSIRTDISHLQLPKNGSATSAMSTLNTGKSFQVADSARVGEVVDDEQEPDELTLVGPNGFGNKLWSDDDETATATLSLDSEADVEEDARLGMVVPSKRGTGSYTTYAKRQVQKEKLQLLSSRAASTNSTALATKRGFSDGFYTSRIFASSSSSLSRLGFAQQYQQDTFQSYISAGQLGTSDRNTYNNQFAAGVQAAESAISYIVRSYAAKKG